MRDAAAVTRFLTHLLRAAPLFAAAVLGACHDVDDGGPDGSAAARPAVLGGGPAGLVNGPAAAARFDNPVNVELGPDGTIYVADFGNDALRAIAPDGEVRTLLARPGFERPFGLALAPDGSLYVQTDTNDSGLRDGTTGTVWRVDTRTGAAAVVVRNVGRPRGLLALADGRIVLSDIVRHDLRLLTPATGAIAPLAGNNGSAGFADATGADARFDRPYGLALAADGSILVADQNNHRIRRVTLAGAVTTFAGTGTAGRADGALATATFNGPQDVATDGSAVYVADTLNYLVRRIAGGSASTIAGTGARGFAPGEGLSAQFYGLEGFDLADDGNTLWIADGTGGDEDVDFNRVRRVRVR
ncbi:hypothetical protein C3942_04220 [Solimonas fluminis]|uniref:SMP-30/Gluconolactonase/LRE-like region domain-containing protein n=1 Tax=Solimonas fluminis TaxID=2086571 RepID=A0A2S5TIT0_9GAMM|nr:hypothetical protein [Solimonas fluminis]PPE74889.1 hypothetical protein C3942_04220 [Solimonas fluminis]